MMYGNKESKRAISPVVAIILLVAIAISAAAIFYAWQARLVTQTQETGAESASQLTSAAGGTLQVLNINSTGLKVKNIGSTSLSNINAYENGNYWCNISATFTGPLTTGETASNWSCNSDLTGPHTIKVIAEDQGVQVVVPFSG